MVVVASRCCCWILWHCAAVAELLNIANADIKLKHRTYPSNSALAPYALLAPSAATILLEEVKLIRKLLTVFLVL